MTPTRQAVTILCFLKGKEVKKRIACDVYGSFAVHPSYDTSDQGDNPPWCTTHIASGYRAGRFTTQKFAIRLAVLLDGLGDWSKVKPGDQTGLRKVALPIVWLVRKNKWAEAERLSAKHVLFG